MNWASENGLPHISVSSLGSLIQFQGRISENDWRKIRSEFLKSTAVSRQSIIEKQISQYKAGSTKDINSIHAEIPDLFTEGDTTIVAVGSSASVVEGHQVEFLSATKLTYVHKCVASVQISIDANAPDALRTFNSYMSHLNIK